MGNSSDISISRRLSFSARRLFSSSKHPQELQVLDESDSSTTADSNDESEETEFKPSTMPSSPPNSDDAYSKAFNNNSAWRRSLAETDPELFESLGKGQSPQILWIAAALDNKKLGLIDTWLMPLRAIRQENLTLLNSLDPKERALKLVELNVRNGAKVLSENPIVIDAMQERGLQIHGLIYNVGTGELRELDIGEDDEIVKSRQIAFKTE